MASLFGWMLGGTKNDSKGTDMGNEKFASKDDLKHYATAADLQKEHKELRNYILGAVALIVTLVSWIVIANVDGKIANVDGKIAGVNGSIVAVDTKVTSLEKVTAAGFEAQKKDVARIESDLKEMRADIQKLLQAKK